MTKRKTSKTKTPAARRRKTNKRVYQIDTVIPPLEGVKLRLDGGKPLSTIGDLIHQERTLTKPDFEPTVIEYPADWWESFKQHWFPWANVETVKLNLWRRTAGHYIAISG